MNLLFDNTPIPKPRIRRGHLMHVSDAGEDVYGDEEMMLRFHCRHCDFESDSMP